MFAVARGSAAAMAAYRGSRNFFSSKRLVQKGLVSPGLLVPAHIPRPPYTTSAEMPPFPPYIPILDTDEQQRLREACALARDIVQFAGTLVEVGRTTDDIDRVVHAEICRRGAYPSPLHYGGFPKSICTSVNEIVVHGIPDNRQLEDGDLVNIDVSVFLNGFHGDTSYTYQVGTVDSAGQALIAATQRALDESISICKAGVPFQAIGARVHDVAMATSHSIIHEFCGHGIGRTFHALPLILHFPNTERGEMLPGMAFTIEPALCEGRNEIVYWDDEWTVATADGKRSAQFEHTLLITDDGGVEVLTL
ncbi:methionine aminopeptidase, type I [Aphanomyces astaci]|uniref:Methionine aminopeptidase n=1 Tax=Aphanomyces astaci TaxID=112090 RepID=W4H9B4_APHAT|nr:methionine aminopeptidase, type I [Aphanomyces astaci]ETV88527.1 methionine aminopeptidase, type I [Aphanomyces astaci]|eukprot:XP_009820927.1 methionine aminopeptidase, type I [Aphanomyces astaci]